MKVVVIGATIAGVAVTQTILKHRPETQVVVFERGADVGFVSAGVPLYVAHQIDRLQELNDVTPVELEQLGARVHTLHDVTQVDAANKKVVVVNLETGEQFTESYDRLVMATGSSVSVPPINGIIGSRVRVLKSHQTAADLAGALTGVNDVGIVGGGYIGVEMAAALADRCRVTIFQAQDQILNPYYDPEIAAKVQSLLEAMGITVYTGDRVTAFDEAEDGGITITTDCHQVRVDTALVATGFVPRRNWC